MPPSPQLGPARPWDLAFPFTLFLSGSLVFLVQPMVARQLLPWLGGSPAVWITAQLFFQAALLLGYLYAHQLTRWSLRTQIVVHALILGASFLLLPIDAVGAVDDARIGAPQGWLLGRLLVSVGLPFVAVAATAPLLQFWFAARRSIPVDPYPLYAAGNLGSLGALLAYPLAIEPLWPLSQQARGWSAGFGLLAAAVVVCGVARLRASGPDAVPLPGVFRLPEWLGWVALAIVPSSLMLSATLFITTDIAPVPLLWVVPLALYLLSFVLAFARKPLASGARLSSWFAFSVSCLVPVLLAGWTWSVWVPLHLLTFFLGAWMVHAEVARRRPPAERLTSFYLALAVGGVIGGLLNAIVSPLLFDRVAEYPIGLFLATLAGVFVDGRQATNWRRSALVPAFLLVLLSLLFANPGGFASTAAAIPLIIMATGLSLLVAYRARRERLRFALGVGAILLASYWIPNLGGEVVHRERDFFGVLTVTRSGPTYRLFHGSTLHGEQDHERPAEPSTYFTREGPVGDITTATADPERAVAVVGLGVGSLAAYQGPNERWDFYEIDPAVARVAADARFFTYWDKALGEHQLFLGDARLRLREAGPRFDLIVLDAFSSDAPPVHLLTLEAFAVYEARLAPSGLIAINLTNRYLDLESVVAAMAREKGWRCLVRRDVRVSADAKKQGRQPSIWAVVARRVEDLDRLEKVADEPWLPARQTVKMRAWTDQSADLVRPFLGRRRSGEEAPSNAIDPRHRER